MVMSTPMILLRSIPIRGNCSWWSRFAIHSKVTATTILFFRKLLLCTLMGQPIMFSTDLAVGKTLPEGRGLPIKIRLSTMKDHFPKETCPWQSKHAFRKWLLPQWRHYSENRRSIYPVGHYQKSCVSFYQSFPFLLFYVCLLVTSLSILQVAIQFIEIVDLTFISYFWEGFVLLGLRTF